MLGYFPSLEDKKSTYCQHHLTIAPWVLEDQTKSNLKSCKVILAIVVNTSIYILVILLHSAGANRRLFKSFMGQVSCFATMHVGPFSNSRALGYQRIEQNQIQKFAKSSWLLCFASQSVFSGLFQTALKPALYNPKVSRVKFSTLS
jgi:hypothetical protein